MIIQGGMGAGVSGYRLANAVSRTGQLGVVSGTALDVILPRRLQVGDPGGDMRRALAHFPLPGVAERIIDRYYIEGGKAPDAPFKAKPAPSPEPSRHLEELLVASNFAEVWLAREGHDGLVGINYLEKIQLPTLPSIYGALMAGVSYVLMGAGIPRTIPGILDSLVNGDPVELKLDVKGADRGEHFFTRFDPEAFTGGRMPWVFRPKFLAIISTAVLGSMLVKKSTGRVDGFVVELPTAGGHNAPPRGQLQLDEAGEPVYGDRDDPDLEAMCTLERPFWLAGSYAEPGRLVEALNLGAAGIQVGTAFAYCDDSDLDTGLKRRILADSKAGVAKVFTDPVASPTGFPFKVVQLDDSLSNKTVYEERTRICDLSYLRHAYKKEDGKLGWRCPSEPVDDYLRKGGARNETQGRKCVCNGLMANIGLGQVQRNSELEKPLVTSGDDVAKVARFLPPGAESYNARDVVEHLLRDVTAGVGIEREAFAV
jgi:nitronate monooxygenase